MGAFIDLLNEARKAIIPPRNSSHEDQYGWRVRIGTLLFICLLSLVIVTGAAWGEFSSFGVPGFVTKPEVENTFASIKQLLDSERAEQRGHWIFDVDQALLTLRVRQCKTTNDDAKQAYDDRMRWLKGEYFKIAGREWPMPMCGDL